MDDNLCRELARKLMEFNFRVGHWNSGNYKKEFKVNGNLKGKQELTSRQYSILFYILKVKVVTVTEIENTFYLSRSSVSITLAKLVDGGYLRKIQPDENEDKRKVFFKITSKGKKSVQVLTERIEEVFIDFFYSLDDERQKKTELGIELLNEIFSENKEA